MIALIMNCIDRYPQTMNLLNFNLSVAGAHVDKTIVNDNGSMGEYSEYLRQWIRDTASYPIINETNIGNAKALNNGMRIAFEQEKCEAVIIMGNDIRMEDHWLLRAIEYAEKIPETGIIGWDWRGNPSAYSVENVNGLDILSCNQDQNVFGCWYLSRKAWEKCGYFSTFSRYGGWDSEYNIRLHKAGFKRYYLPKMKSFHEGGDYGASTQYRRMKNEEMAIAKKPLAERVKEIHETGKYYVTFDNRLI